MDYLHVRGLLITMQVKERIPLIIMMKFRYSIPLSEYVVGGHVLKGDLDMVQGRALVRPKENCDTYIVAIILLHLQYK
jgi:hypothetical protein